MTRTSDQRRDTTWPRSAGRKRVSTTAPRRPRGSLATVDEQDCQQRSAPCPASTAGHPRVHVPEKPAGVGEGNSPSRRPPRGLLPATPPPVRRRAANPLGAG